MPIDPTPPRVRTWDLPTRLAHWSLAAATVAAFLTGDDVRRTDVHAWLGATVAGLVAFRVAWGFLGERWSRWSAFPLRRDAGPDHPGHPRSGAWSVVFVLAVLVAITATGVVVLGGEEGRGPLAGLVGAAAGLDAHAAHQLVAWVLPAWLAAHLAGVVLHGRRTRAPVVRAMVDGAKPGTHAPVAPRAGVAAALALGLAAGALLAFAPPRRDAAPLPTDAGWTSACGDCHLAYAPSLLPALAWERMLDTQADHFGEDLALDLDTVAALRAWAGAHAAEAGATEMAVRVARSVPAGAAPQRVTETPAWRAAHADLPDATFDDPDVASRARCGACHPDAEAGTFEGPLADPPSPRR